MVVIWLTATFNSYLLAFAMKNFPGSIQTNGLFRSFGKLGGAITSASVYQYVGVQKCFAYNFALAGIGGILMLYY
jgi:hypothetical protein